MKKILLALALITNAHALTAQYCASYGTGVSLSFQSCVNSNFLRIATEAGSFASYCMNISQDKVDFSFESCINNNFMRLDSKVGVYTNYCMNFNDDLGIGFQGCVNNNFNRLVSELNSIGN